MDNVAVYTMRGRPITDPSKFTCTRSYPSVLNDLICCQGAKIPDEDVEWLRDYYNTV